MKINRIIILGIDALDYDTVVNEKLDTFKQAEFGKVRPPIVNNRISSPIIWASFITGKTPSVHKIRTFKQWNSGLVDGAHQLLGNKSPKFMRKLASKTLRRMGVNKVKISKQHYACSTIFDDHPNTWALNIPTYNEIDSNLKVRASLKNVLGDDERSKQTEELLWKEEGKNMELFLTNSSKYKLSMIYISLLDIIQHMYPGQRADILPNYKKIEEFVQKVKKTVDMDTLLLIVSDHGCYNGMHTEFGFYSVNRKLGLKTPDIMDFRDIFKSIISNTPIRKAESKRPVTKKGKQGKRVWRHASSKYESKKEHEKIKENLKALGYFD